MLECGPVWIDI